MDAGKSCCPQRDAFEKFFLNDAGRAEREALADHVRVCPNCRARFDMLRELGADVRARRAEFLALAAASARELAAIDGEKGAAGARRWAPIAATVILVIAAAAASFLVFGRRESSAGALRNRGAAHLRLISPAGRQVRIPKVFRWSAVPGADSYFFELINNDLETVISSTQVFAPAFTPPAATLAKLRNDRTYIWSVEARGDDGLKIESSQQSFDIRDGD